jgi:cytochrome oxidase Cu insertion factor (SCO1/SenC/PrrC family)
MKINVLSQKFFMAGLGLMLAGGCAGTHRTPGKVAPNFELTDLSGQKVSLAQHKGHVVMVCFWAVG